MSRSVVYSVNWAVDVTFETEWIDGKKEELTQSSLMSHENYAYERQERAKHVFASIVQGRHVKSQTLVIQFSTFRNNLSISMQILHTVLHLVGDQYLFLVTLTCDPGVIFSGEIRCLSLIGIKRKKSALRVCCCSKPLPPPPTRCYHQALSFELGPPLIITANQNQGKNYKNSMKTWSKRGEYCLKYRKRNLTLDWCYV